MNLFVYGSLQFADVWYVVTGTRPRTEPAHLQDHCVRRVRGASYPALVRRAGDVASGRLVRGVSRRALRRLDAFEGASYARRRVVVGTAHGRAAACVYAWHPAARARLSDSGWDAAAFDLYHRRRFAAYWRRRLRRTPNCV